MSGDMKDVWSVARKKRNGGHPYTYHNYLGMFEKNIDANRCVLIDVSCLTVMQGQA